MSISPRPLEIPDLVLEPLNEASMIAAIESAANSRQQSLLVVDLKKSIASIRHKLSIVMYQAALICAMNAGDLRDFETYMRNNQAPPDPSQVYYKGCTYEMENIYHYRLLAGFFVESFAAATWSLFDVIGFLIRDLYSLNLKSGEVDFKKAVDALGAQKSTASTPDAIHAFLLIYRTYSDTSKNHPPLPAWFPLLTEVRHRTTHRPITDICYVHIESSMYPEINAAQGGFYLNRDLLSPPGDQLLCDFAREVFREVQLFVEELYDLVCRAVNVQGSLPLS